MSEPVPTKDILALEDIHVYYGAIHALKGVSLRVGEQGQPACFLQPA